MEADAALPTKKNIQFTLEDDVALKTSPAAESSRRLYKSKLNGLAKLGLGLNRAELKKNHKEVIAHIEGLYPDDEGGRQKKRVIIYAVF